MRFNAVNGRDVRQLTISESALTNTTFSEIDIHLREMLIAQGVPEEEAYGYTLELVTQPHEEKSHAEYKPI